MNRRDLFKTLGIAGAAYSATGTIPASVSAGTHGKQNTVHSMEGYGVPAGAPQHIVMLAYPQMTLLDLVGPQQIFSLLGNIRLHVVWKSKELITTDSGMIVQPTTTFASCPANPLAVFVPGGSLGTLAVMNDSVVLKFLAEQGAAAKYVTSVCTGSMVLAAAGLLHGYRATSHWTVRDQLADFGAIPINARVVEDRNRITGAGVTAGLDFALRLTSRIRSEKMAQAIQLAYEYDPQPPFHAGSPATAPAEITEMERAMYAPVVMGMKAAAKRSARK